MSPNLKAIPPAYFITFTCYGTWLHGEKSTSVTRRLNTPGTEFLPFNEAHLSAVKNRMTETPYTLDNNRRHIVLNAIQEVCIHRQWVLLAAHVRTNHIHLVIHAYVQPEFVMNAIKSYASRHLNASKLDGKRTQRWTRHGSTQYLWREAQIETSIHYVIHEQGQPMAVFENKNRNFDLR